MNTCPVRSFAQAVAMASVMAAPGSAATPESLAIPILKDAYLNCERKALVHEMSAGEIAWCTEVYEALKVRAFSGDWRRLWKWTRENLASGPAV